MSSTAERAQRKKDDDLVDESKNGSPPPLHHGEGADGLARQLSAASAASSHNPQQQQQGTNDNKRTRRNSNSPGVLINAGLFSMALFFALIQFFDPLLQEHHAQDRAHHARHHSPVTAGLADFAAGKQALREALRRAAKDNPQHHDPQQQQQQPGTPLTLEGVSRGRERILQLLKEAGVLSDLSLAEMDRLPRWKTVRTCVCAPLDYLLLDAARSIILFHYGNTLMLLACLPAALLLSSGRKFVRG